MKKVFLFILLSLLAFPTLLHSQESVESGTVLIRGTLTDETGNPIEIANIWVARRAQPPT